MNWLKETRFDAWGWSRGWLWMLSLFLVGLGAKLWLIQRFGTPLPFWDQWEEARVVYVPYFEGKLSLPDLFSAHNEHRILCTRLYSLALLLLNGQWDGQLQMVVNAVIHCATLAGLGWLMCRWLEKKYWVWIWLPLVLVLALPFGWENSLAGFQSQFYFLVVFSLLTLWLLGLYPPLSARWWCGAAAAIMALFTVASGFLAAAAVLGLVMFRIWGRPKSWKKQAPTLAFCAAVVVAGLLLKADVRHHHLLQAHSVGEFLMAFGDNLAWPWIVVPPFALLNLLPLAALAWCHYFRAAEDRPAEEMTLAIGIWAILQGAATSYARGAEGKPPGWRYMDSSSFILIANCLSIAVLMSRHWPTPAASGNFQFSILKAQFPIPRPMSWLRRSARRVLLTAFILWGVVCAIGLALLTARAWQIDIPERHFYCHAQLQNTRAFMATDDIRVLDHKPKPQLALYEGDPYAPRPLHEGEKLAKALRNPIIRDILPACARLPLEVRANQEATRGFVTNGFRLARPEPPTEVSWGSWSAQRPLATRTFESLPIQKSRLPYLEIPVAGYLSQTDLSLELIDLATDKRIPVKPRATAGEKWLTCYVQAPAGEFKIVAHDSSETAWFAFKAPREVGRLSFWAVCTLKAWRYLLFAGLGFLLLDLVTSLLGDRGHDDFDLPASTDPKAAQPSRWPLETGGNKRTA
jgi:hypothetical protein